MKNRLIGTLLTTSALAALASPATAQTQSSVVIAGYGTATYEAATTEEYPNDFTASVAPVILYSMGSDILFETELEFGLSGTGTTTALEYAQIDYLGFEKFQIIAGKFLLPFGVFGERLHPSWINKLPTGPVTYGHAHGGVAEDGLLPVLSDAGLLVRFAQPIGSKWMLDFSGWVSQGPRTAAEEGDDHADDADDHDGFLQAAVVAADPEHGPEEIPAPPVAFGTSFSDNNKNKMIGARLGVVRGPSFEIYASGFQAMYDAGNFLDYQGGALSVEWRRNGFELRGEGIITRQEFQGDDHFEWLEKSGFYAQLSKRSGSWEPVVRWGTLADGTVDDATVSEGHNEFAIGLNYWLQATVPVKVAYEIHENQDDRFFVQWAFGF